jgi:HK97 family phage major capsid protein
MYRSLIPVTLELLQDSAFDLEAWIRDQLITRLGRGTNVHFTTGNGTTQPKGFIPGSARPASPLASATSISTDDLVEPRALGRPGLPQGPSVGWQFNDGTLKVLKKLKDTQNRPLWLPGFAVKEPDTILATRTSSTRTWPRAGVEQVARVRRLVEVHGPRRAQPAHHPRERALHRNGQIGFFLFSRHGSNVLDAGTDPIKHLTHPSPD